MHIPSLFGGQGHRRRGCSIRWFVTHQCLSHDVASLESCCISIRPQAGHAYTYTSDTCITPPATPDAISETTSGQYVLACVVWSPTSFAELEQMAELPCPNFASHFWAILGPIVSYQLSGPHMLAIPF